MLNNAQKRDKVSKSYNLGTNSILAICEKLHMIKTGASEYDKHIFIGCVSFLTCVLETWDSDYECDYDKAVKFLIEETLDK